MAALNPHAQSWVPPTTGPPGTEDASPRAPRDHVAAADAGVGSSPRATTNDAVADATRAEPVVTSGDRLPQKELPPDETTAGSPALIQTAPDDVVVVVVEKETPGVVKAAEAQSPKTVVAPAPSGGDAEAACHPPGEEVQVEETTDDDAKRETAVPDDVGAVVVVASAGAAAKRLRAESLEAAALQEAAATQGGGGGGGVPEPAAPSPKQQPLDDEGDGTKDRADGAARDAPKSAAPTNDPQRTNPKSSPSPPSEQQRTHTVRPEDFLMVLEIGSGAFGRVTKVIHAPTQRHYAMKAISKKVLRKKKVAQREWRLERDVLVKIEPHPYVVELVCAFQTTSSFYLVMTYLPGGELFDFLRSRGFFAEDVAAFYAAETTLALEHLHASGVIHRDLKPENLLLDLEGHVVVTDFGLAKMFESHDEVHRTLCGTDAYMAPEMVARRSYGRAVDFWSLGVLIYEMLAGKPPFAAKDVKDLHRKILTEKVKFPSPNFSATGVACLRGLLERQVPKRLGSTKATMFEVGGVDALKQHAFFKRIEWQPLARRESPAPLQVLPLEQRLLAAADDKTNGASVFPLKVLNNKRLDETQSEFSVGTATMSRAVSKDDSDAASTVADFEYCRDDRFVPPTAAEAPSSTARDPAGGGQTTSRRLDHDDDGCADDDRRGGHAKPPRAAAPNALAGVPSGEAPFTKARLDSPTSSQGDVSSSCGASDGRGWSLATTGSDVGSRAEQSGLPLGGSLKLNSAKPRKPRPPRKRKNKQASAAAAAAAGAAVAGAAPHVAKVSDAPTTTPPPPSAEASAARTTGSSSSHPASRSSSSSRTPLESIPDSPAHGAASAPRKPPRAVRLGPPPVRR